MTVNDLLDPNYWAQNPDLLMLALPAAAGLLLVVIALLVGDGSSDRKSRRIKRVQNVNRPESVAEKVISIRKKNQDSSIPFIDRFIKKALPRPEVLRNRLARTGLKLNLATYIAINIVLGGLAAAGSLATVLVPNVAAPLIGVFVGIGVPHLAISFFIARRTKNFIAKFPEAIDLMVRGLKSGLPIGESVKAAGEEIPDPVGMELKEITDSVRIGKKLEDAMNEAGKRLDIQEFSFMTVAMSIQSETGGNLAETLQNLSDVLRRRRQLVMKIKALSSEAKASSYIIGSLPFIMAFMIYLTNNAYLMPLIDDPRGNFMVFLGFCCYLVGIGVMYKMVKFEI